MRVLMFLHCFLLSSLPRVLSAQSDGFRDDFSDGSFLSDPVWFGDTTRWAVVPFRDGYALRSDGEARQDTITLATASRASYGTWSFFFRHENIALSNFNGARIYLTADEGDLRGNINGYYIQMGTNNLRRVELWRQDGPPGNRTRLAQSASDFLPGTENDVWIRVERSAYDEWSVWANEEHLFTVYDGRHVASRYFGIWVRHSTAAGQSFYFDDFHVEGTAYVDVTPPEPLSARTSNDGLSITVDWSEPLDPFSVKPDGFLLNGLIQPVETTYREEITSFLTTLQLSDSLAPGEHVLSFFEIADTSGNVVDPGLELVFLHDPDLEPPFPVSVQVASETRLHLRFNEPVENESATRLSNYELIPGAGHPSVAEHPIDVDSAEVGLTFSQSFADQTLYVLHVSGVTDRHGNELRGGSISFFTGEPDRPEPGDIVINEVFYDPPTNDLEFVEVYNRSERIFDLAQFEIADDRMNPVQVTTERYILGPGEYAVLARDASAVHAAYPGAGAVRVTGLPVFNRGGDSVVLLAESVVVDSMGYTPSWGGQGVSLERIDPRGPSTRRENWTSSVDERGATPGRRNSVHNPDLTPPVVRFVDQTGDSTLVVFFDEPVEPVLPDQFSLAGEVPVEVSMTENDEAVTLVFNRAVNNWEIDVSGVSDLSGNVLSGASHTVARLARPGVLTVNEIMFAPLADRFDNRPDQPQYVELVNTSDAPVSLRNLSWTGPVDEAGTADSLLLTSGLVAVPPYGYAIIVAEREIVDDYTTQSMLANAFPEIDFASPEVVIVPLNRATLGIRRTADLIRLHAPDGTLLEDVAYDVSWHHPDLLSTTGISLERISLDRPVHARDNWKSSVAPSGGTPGLPNSIFIPSTGAPDAPGLAIEPEVFSPDGDGIDDVAAIRYLLSSDAASVRVRIFDSHGRIVRTLEDAAVSGRKGTLLWDGRDDNRRELRIGIYIVLLESIDIEAGVTEAFKKPVVLARRLQ